MATIIIKTQAELDALPAKFDNWTEIRIEANTRIIVRCKRENSSVEARGNSSVEARENSSVVAWGNSSVEAYQFAVVLAFSFMALRLFDWAAVRLKREGLKHIEINGSKVTQINDLEAEEIPFDTWLERGYVVADGITANLVERSKDGEIDVFKVADFKKKESYVIRKGDKFAHGETLPEARADLDFKINGRDTSRFKAWKRTEPKPVGEMIVAYRAITGACSMGVRDFIKGAPKLPDEVSPETVIGLIGESYGARAFKRFFEQ